MQSLEMAPAGTATMNDIPSNLYKLANPWPATVLENTRLTAEDSPNDVRHIVFDLEGSDYRYVEGQSAGILPPGIAENGKPHKLRLYSIASPSIGDDGHGKTLSLCVKRAITHLPETGETFYGVCSSYLCDAKPGDIAQMSGPVGKGFLMPPAPDANLIMISTGTGIAPFRSFLYDRYKSGNRTGGQVWNFFGCQTSKDYLYADEMEAYKAYDGFNQVNAFSREQQNAQGGRMYVQHRLIEHAQAIMTLLKDSKTSLYICGLKGMETGIIEGLSEAATNEGLDWDQLFSQLKSEKRWLVEVY